MHKNSTSVQTEPKETGSGGSGWVVDRPAAEGPAGTERKTGAGSTTFPTTPFSGRRGHPDELNL